MIKIVSAQKHYKLGGETVKALDGVDLKIADGEFVAVVGPSGSGKTTLMHCIGGIDKLDEGSIIVGDSDISKMNDKELSKYRNKTIGFVFQTFNLQPNLTAAENVALPLIFSGTNGKEAKQRAEKALEKVGLGDRIGHRPGQLSGGQRQRVSIARSLVNEPSILLADEPTGNLDSHTGKKIIKLLQDLSEKEKITFIVVTHDDRIAEKASRVIYILDGKIQKEIKGRKKSSSKYLD
ncbi:ABC transporter ATP-binding protein [Candidatus Dojkabacteria bacterium]|nr:ABC transporter ATP-binding protein [Candidatus Dojkabacteria bacterium]